MGQILREDWKTKMLETISSGKFTEFISAITVAITWIGLRLAEREIPFKVLNFGAEIKKITTDLETCPKCHGTGKI